VEDCCKATAQQHRRHGGHDYLVFQELGMEVGNDKHLKLNSETNWEPVKSHKNRCNMTELGRERNNSSSCVPHTLELFSHVLG